MVQSSQRLARSCGTVHRGGVICASDIDVHEEGHHQHGEYQIRYVFVNESKHIHRVQCCLGTSSLRYAAADSSGLGRGPSCVDNSISSYQTTQRVGVIVAHN